MSVGPTLAAEGDTSSAIRVGGERSGGRRLLAWSAILLAIYFGLSFITDSGATLGADEGAKVATLRVMAERGSLTPDVGYWAAQWDPNATYHGLYFTTRIGDRYINVTSLPMILAAEPLYALGGYRLALLLPMLGGVASALAARALARRLAAPSRSERAGRYAFWLVGLASPVTIYAIDLWEHTLGLAAMAWGVVFLIDAVGIGHRPGTRPADAVDGPVDGSERTDGEPNDLATGAGAVAAEPAPAVPSVRRTEITTRSAAVGALAGGACFGLAAAMRTEAIAYLAVVVAVAAFAAGFPRRWARPIVVGVAALAGFAALFLANAVLETLVLGASIRSTRAAGAAGAGGQGLSGRVHEGLTTLLSLAPSLDVTYLVYGAIFTVAVGVWALAAAGRLPRLAEVVAIVVAVLVVVQRLMDGTGFWPGLFATTPLAAVGLFLGWRRPGRWLVVMALVALPLVFLFQFPGGALPQWGGRYILLSGFLLGVVGVVALVELPRSSRLGLMGLAVIVTLIGLAWSSQRTHDYAAAGDELNRRPEDVLISPDGFPPREFGSTWGTKNWLATVPTDVGGAVDVARRSGATTFAVVELDGSRELPSFSGYHEVGRSQVGGLFTVVSYAAN